VRKSVESENDVHVLDQLVSIRGRHWLLNEEFILYYGHTNK